MDINQILERNFTRITDEYRDFACKKNKCKKCSVYKHYNQVVQAEGNAKNPTFMFVGESAGEDEVRQNRPFIGASGQVLRGELRKYPKVFKKTNTIVSNVLACRPLNNAFSSVEEREVDICTSNWLFEEIQLLQPKIIVTLGNSALKYVIRKTGITANRGKWEFLSWHRSWSFATYHPSYVMRSKNDGRPFIVEQFINDIKLVAKMSHTMAGDSRLCISSEEWKRQAAIEEVVSLGLAGL